MARSPGQPFEAISVGVIGVGSMGKHHARVYSQIPHVDLVGVADADNQRATAVADEYVTAVMEVDELLEVADAVSVAVPTKHHFAVGARCIDAGVNVLIEKPFVSRLSEGRELIDRADGGGVCLQVGHVERFNPAVATLQTIVDDFEPVAIDVNRLGPPRSRDLGDSAVVDLMIHDIDVVLSLLGSEPTQVISAGTTDNEYATAMLRFDRDIVVTLTASRLTQRKVRSLEFTAKECFIEVDFLNRSVEIHRHSNPEFVASDEGLSYRHESVIERPMVENGEPLQRELVAFIDAVLSGREPIVSGEDGLRALAISRKIERRARKQAEARVEVMTD